MNADNRTLHTDTLAFHTALPPSQYGENSEALFLTSGYVQPDAATAARRFGGEEEGYTYSRLGNPTVTSMEMRLAALEGTEAAIATSTGMSAILLMCMGLLKAGDHVICSHSMFGSTIKLIGGEFGKFGVQSSFVSQTDVAQRKAAVRPNTRLLFAETPMRNHRPRPPPSRHRYGMAHGGEADADRRIVERDTARTALSQTGSFGSVPCGFMGEIFRAARMTAPLRLADTLRVCCWPLDVYPTHHEHRRCDPNAQGRWVGRSRHAGKPSPIQAP